VIPGLRQGHITFGPGSFPDLDEARELLPEYAGLWAAIDGDRRAMLSEVAQSGPAAQDHAAFFDLPPHLTDAERRPPLLDH
jgi:hypothetical protein